MELTSRRVFQKSNTSIIKVKHTQGSDNQGLNGKLLQTTLLLISLAFMFTYWCTDLTIELQASTISRVALTCRAAPPRSQPWLGWSPGGRRCDSRSCNTRARSPPAARLYVMSPPCIWLSPGDSQCDWKPGNRRAVEMVSYSSVTFVLVSLTKKKKKNLKIAWQYRKTAWTTT